MPTIEQSTHRCFSALCLIVLAFSCEIPLINVTPWYRVNPRAFDAALAVFVLALFLDRRIGALNQGQMTPVLRPWRLCAIGMVLGHVASLLWIDREYYHLSIFYALKYVISYVFLWHAFQIPLSEKRLLIVLRTLSAGCILTSIVSLLQFCHVVGPLIRVTAEGSWEGPVHHVTGILEVGYWNSACHGVLCLAVAAAMISIEVGVWKVYAIATAILALLGALASGSRTGVFLVGLYFVFRIVVAFTFSWLQGVRSGVTALVVLTCIGSLVWCQTEDFVENSFVFGRLQSTVEATRYGDTTEGIDIWSRVKTPFVHIMALCDAHPIRSLLLGCGYGYVPDGEFADWQHVHNIWFWPMQYGGLLPTIGFLWLTVTLAREMYMTARYSSSAIQVHLAMESLAFFGAWVVIGFAGQVFWFYEGLNNFNNLLLLLWGLVCQRAVAVGDGMFITPWITGSGLCEAKTIVLPHCIVRRTY